MQFVTQEVTAEEVDRLLCLTTVLPRTALKLIIGVQVGTSIYSGPGKLDQKVA